MHGIPWVKNISLNIEKNPLDVADFLGYEEHVKTAESELWQQITKEKQMNYSGLDALCTNLKYNHKGFGTWNAKSTSKSGIYEKNFTVLQHADSNFSEETTRNK